MKRALAEYEVHGIKTTIPFFQWVLDDPEFLAAAFDTGFIERKLAERGGAPFNAPSADEETLAVIAAAVHAAMRPVTDASPATPASRWVQAGRAEALR